MPWLINNSSGCKYYQYDLSDYTHLIKIVNNHHKKHTNNKVNLHSSNLCGNVHIIKFKINNLNINEHNNIVNNKNELKKKLEKHFGNVKVQLNYKRVSKSILSRDPNTKELRSFSFGDLVDTIVDTYVSYEISNE